MTSVNPIVLELLGWTEEQFSWHLYHRGLEQIAELLRGQVTTLSDLEDSQQFWDDFKERWYEWDESWLNELFECGFMERFMETNYKPCKEVLDSYNNYHKTVAFSVLPVSVQRVIQNQLYKESIRV